jgi:lipopolysaccharide/colanic/teichoic acid biosynthesis glycosyltransferase
VTDLVQATDGDALAVPPPGQLVLAAITPATRFQLGVKRTIDLLGATLAIAIALPIGLAIAVLVKATSKGPILFVQERVGRDGKPFRLLKFRSMVDGAERQILACDESRAAYEANDFKLSRNDPRITKVGRVLRAASLDELPQLFNVLVGSMSLVGVRPLLARELAMRSDRSQQCYRAMKPGMTGLWQVVGRSSVDAPDRRRLDREYVDNWSLWQDVKILARTPLAVVVVRRTK